jgi:guanylate kinase
MDNTSQDILERITNELESYHPSDATMKLVQETPIVLLVGISGAGKDTIKQKLLDSGKYHHVVSHTTRMPRVNHGVAELDGVEYHFISLAEAHKMLQAGEYVEAKMYSGNVYGTSAEEVKKAHEDEKIAITDVEVQGVAEYKAISSNVIAVFVLPPDYNTWRTRIIKRYGGEGVEPADLLGRMQTAVKELEDALAKDYYHFVVNDDLDRAVKAIDAIAHNRDQFTEKDVKVREQGQALLTSIRENLAEL